MDKNLHPTQYADSYSTGNVQVPKKRRGIVPIVLLCVIFVLCIASSYDFFYGSLFADEEDTGMVFAKDLRFAHPEEGDGYAQIDTLDIHGRVLTAFDQQYFDLPQGVYITTTSPMVDQLQVGDVLLGINGTQVTDLEALNQMLSGYNAGTTLELEIYRGGKTQVITTTLQKKENG